MLSCRVVSCRVVSCRDIDNVVVSPVITQGSTLPMLPGCSKISIFFFYKSTVT